MNLIKTTIVVYFLKFNSLFYVRNLSTTILLSSNETNLYSSEINYIDLSHYNSGFKFV